VNLRPLSLFFLLICRLSSNVLAGNCLTSLPRTLTAGAFSRVTLRLDASRRMPIAERHPQRHKTVRASSEEERDNESPVHNVRLVTDNSEHVLWLWMVVAVGGGGSGGGGGGDD
jgi:hypothetical protein